MNLRKHYLSKVLYLFLICASKLAKRIERLNLIIKNVLKCILNSFSLRFFFGKFGRRETKICIKTCIALIPLTFFSGIKFQSFIFLKFCIFASGFWSLFYKNDWNNMLKICATKKNVNELIPKIKIVSNDRPKSL